MMINISNLIIEVTRKCNIECTHCLRGNAQKKDIMLAYIDELLCQTKYIDNITFSGGEPSLNVKAIDYFLTTAKSYAVSIGRFYIATNGITINENFVIACLRLYVYSEDKESNMVVVSNDEFHASEENYNTELLDGLSFFSRKHIKEGYNYAGGSTLIREGRAAENFNCRTIFPVSDIKTIDDFNDASIYLNAKGEIINGCDWSYVNQSKHILCKVGQLTEFYESLIES